MTGHNFAPLPVSDGLVFVDSNVLLYALDETDPTKQHAAQAWKENLWKTRRGRLSFQVLSEFYVNALRIRPAASESARAEVRDLLLWDPIVTDANLLELGWNLQDRF